MKIAKVMIASLVVLLPLMAQKEKTEEMPPTPKSSTGEEPMNQRSELHLDTMEFRPSDAGLHRFIPGAL